MPPHHEDRNVAGRAPAHAPALGMGGHVASDAFQVETVLPVARHRERPAQGGGWPGNAGAFDCHGFLGRFALSAWSGMLERVEGFEPSSEAWGAPVLPLSYTRVPVQARGLSRENTAAALTFRKCATDVEKP